MQFTDVDFLLKLMPLILALCVLLCRMPVMQKIAFTAVSLFLLWQCSSFAFWVLLLLSAVTLLIARLLPHLRTGGLPERYLWLTGVAVNVIVLGAFWFNASAFGARDPMPFGLSYFVFKAVSLLTDVRRRKYPQPRLDEMALYLLCFMQFTCGPLSRAEHFSGAPQVSYDRICKGLQRFMTGYCKKVLLADLLAVLIRNTALYSGTDTALTWLASVCYSLQLYYDFSGYSDMAIGLTNLLGYDCPENFDYPYMTASVSEFWRRWHITLGAWFRDYVYIPLGGSRVRTLRLVCNLFVVWLLTGLWHGSGLNFLIWAGGFFLLIVFEKLTGLPKKLRSRALRILYRIAVLVFINFQWVWFSAENTASALKAIRAMLIPMQAPLAAERLQMMLVHGCAVISAAVLFCFPVVPRLRAFAEKRGALRVYQAAGTVLLCAAFVWAVSFVAAGANNPFVYANF